YNTIYLPTITLNYFNNDSAIRNVTRSASIYDEVWDNLYDPGNSSTQDILPQTAVSHNISAIYPFQFARGDTASYLTKAWLRTDAFDNKQNDTIYRRQLFRDYFAYDDGTAERAYGLRGQGSANGRFAVRFTSFIADELGGVDIYFTQLKDSLNLGYYYKFMVWDDDNGMPGDILYEDAPDNAVEYADSLNTFIRYKFKETVSISGTFYVGLLQYNQFLLNVGMDINKPATGNLLYNLGNEWQPSSAPGSLMLRPFVMRSYSSDDGRKPGITNLRIGPNPAGDYLFVEPSPEAAAARIQLSVYDITGRVVDSYGEVGREVFTGHLPEGVYLFRFTSDKFHFKTERIIIKR
ncbi:MAG: T9SS type A sorting domain-containing protein, partial [Bacteroidales bacterium]|nr:T9SS type A sorting domain-containing protein [Bacteroidales bacterium]